MKSRTLSSDQTAFRKLISRFSPLWVWYSVFLLLVYLLNLTGFSTPFSLRTQSTMTSK